MFRFVRFNLRRISALSIISLLSLVVYAAVGQDTMTSNEPLPESDAHMQDLSWFIGEWDVHSRMLMDADTDEWLEEDLHTIHTYEMGGHLIFEHFFGPLGGAPFEAWSLRTYNENTGKWEQRWVDVGPGGFANWIGSWEDGQFMGYAERYIDAEGNILDKTAAREIFDNISEDSFDWRYETTDDGGETWTVTWTLDYVRAEME